MSTLVLVLGAWNLILSVLSLREGMRSGANSNVSPPSSPCTVTLFVPCCGEEEGLEDNLRALASQDFPALDIRYVVRDRQDGAIPAIERTIASHGGTLVIAGAASGRGQKVHNLLHALGTATASDVWAFADSDGRPDPSWLRALVAPLSQDGVGAASTYRFYVPQRGSMATSLRTVWNQSVLSLLGDHDRNFAWGGGMAIRRDVFDAIDVHGAWQGAVSDDYALTHAVRGAGLLVAFVPEAVVPSYGGVGLAELLRWVGRQMTITRVYWPALFWVAVIHHAQFTAFFVTGFWAAGVPGGLLWGVVQILGMMTAYIRGKKAPWSHHLEGRRLTSALWVPVASFITLQGALRALLSRRIEWRGQVYDMRSPTKTVILR